VTRRLVAWLGVVAAALLLSAPQATGAVKVRFDRDSGVRIRLAGRSLDARLIPRPNWDPPDARQELFGRLVRVGCGTDFRDGRGRIVRSAAMWPIGLLRVRFLLSGDVSRRAKWCFIEDSHAADVAFVSFVQREHARLVAKGRGRSGDWWRMAARRGSREEPCVLFRSRDAGRSEQCWSRGIRLGVDAGQARCGGDSYVYGVTRTAAAAVWIRASDGSRMPAGTFARPTGSRVRGTFFIAVLPGAVRVERVSSIDPRGRTIASLGFPFAPRCGGSIFGAD